MKITCRICSSVKEPPSSVSTGEIELTEIFSVSLMLFSYKYYPLRRLIDLTILSLFYIVAMIY